MLTQGAFLAVHAKADQTSPVLRGKFVRAQLFCTPPPPPPPTIVVAPPVVDPRLPTRQRFAQHTADPVLRRLPHHDGPHRLRVRALRTPPASGATPTPTSRSTRPAR